MVHCDKIEIQKVGQDQISRGVCYGFGKQEHFRRDCVQRKDEGFSGYSKNCEKQAGRHRYNIESFWVLPYIPSFYQYNSRIIQFRDRKGPGLDVFHVEEALAALDEMRWAVDRVKRD